MGSNASFQWGRQPEAEQIFLQFIEECKEQNPFIAFFEKDLRIFTSTPLLAWIDHVIIESSDAYEHYLAKSGFTSDSAGPNYRVFHHPGAQLPTIKLCDPESEELGIAIKVDAIADFLMTQGVSESIEGSLFSGYRRCCVSSEKGVSFWVIERRGTRTLEPTHAGDEQIKAYLQAKEQWKQRLKDPEDEDTSMEEAIDIAEKLVDRLGKDLVAWIVLECEREYWQSRNRAAQIQKGRQDRLGLGWANHDHHTFRSSRKRFHQLVRLFEILGFHCRERFYAGEEAGWGAQVMENSHCGIVLFLDVDLAPEELEIDFAHHPLEPLKKLGTIGLWCALHGESILKAGMHHLEAQFIFQNLTEDLKAAGVGMMKPFSDLDYLKQAFTAGEVWQVNPYRVQTLLDQGFIDRNQAEHFLEHGAVGSHLENLERKEGYKGFNPKNVSDIIKRTDPRFA
ncbi:MAG: hypothetical protein Tsb0021_15770 [Chlamydiales bacterium]